MTVVPPILHSTDAVSAPQAATTSSVPATLPPTTQPPAPPTAPATTTPPPTTLPVTTLPPSTIPATTASTVVPTTEPAPQSPTSTVAPATTIDSTTVDSTTTTTTIEAPAPREPDDTESATILTDVQDRRGIVVPLVGGSRVGSGFNDCTNECTTFHKGVDLHAEKLQPVVSPVDGVVVAVLDHPAAGAGVVIRDRDGYEYRLYHLNNDSPFSDDDHGSSEWRLGPGVHMGAAVSAGQLVGYVGDSGNVEGADSRLYFEIRRPDGTSIDPSGSLDAAVDDGWLCAPATAVTDEWLTVSGVAVSPTGFRPLDGAGCVPDAVAVPPSTTTAPVSAPEAGPVVAAEAPVVALVASAPRAPTVTVFGASVRVSFSPPASNGGATITRYTATCASSNGGTTRAGSATASPVNVYGLTLGRTYRCNVRATNADGTSAASVVSTPFLALVGPSAPRTLTALVAPSSGTGSGRVRLWWPTPASTGGAAIADYVVQISTTGSTWTTVNDGASTATWTTISGLTNGRRYWFRVAARNAGRLGAWSPVVSGVPRWVPGAPRSPSVTAYPTSASVRFAPPASNGGAAITRSTATCTSSNGGAARSGSASTTPVVVYNLTPNRTYRCVVRATNAVGVSAASSPTAAFCAGTGCQPTGPTGTWTRVTPSNMSLAGGACDSYGATTVVVDPRRPSNLYAHSDCFGIWRSTNYGSTWTGPINTGRNGASAGNCAGGIAIAPGSGSAPTLYQSCIRGAVGFWRSLDGGVNWTRYNIAPTSRQDYYPPVVDPYDGNHLVMAGHEFSGIVESTNGGQSWRNVSTPGSTSGTSWLFIVNTGSSSTTRTTWLYTSQTTGGNFGTWRTTNGGASWTRVESLEHAHGTMQLFQPDASGVLFMAGQYGSSGHGVYRSTDYGATWRRVGIQMDAVAVWGTPNRVYAAYSWACGSCNVAANFQSAPTPGTSGWTRITQPPAMAMGPASVAVTFDGTNYIFVSGNWRSGLWRYVEP